jgi:hypothetical protein
MNATEIIAQITKQAESHKPDVRRVASMAVGEVARQGDVYLTRVDASHKRGKAISDRQLAPGTTKGSRHILATPEAKLYAPAEPGPLTGPVVDSPTRRVYVEHPEHGHLDLPLGCYQTTYQRDYAKERADEVRRVAD